MSERAGVNLTVSVNVSLLVHGAAPELLGLGLGWGLGCLNIENNPRWVRVRVRVRVGGGMGHLKTENTQVVPPPAFYCINHNQARPLQSEE